MNFCICHLFSLICVSYVLYYPYDSMFNVCLLTLNSKLLLFFLVYVFILFLGKYCIRPLCSLIFISSDFYFPSYILINCCLLGVNSNLLFFLLLYVFILGLGTFPYSSLMFLCLYYFCLLLPL